MTKVIGIDTKSTSMHWVSSFGIGTDTDAGEKYGWTECKDKDVDIRRIQLVNYAYQFFHTIHLETFKDDAPVQIFCEEPLALQNGKTTRLLGLAAGAIYGAFVLSTVNAHWHWVDQSTWKKNVLGRGIRPKGWGADLPKAQQEKDWIMKTVRELPGFQVMITPHVAAEDFDSQPDLYDAWAIKTYGVRVLA